jgi:hypothetical protein
MTGAESRPACRARVRPERALDDRRSGVSPAGAVAEVKQFLRQWWTEGEPAVGAGHFGVTAQVLIGAEGSDLADSFDCIVCSPSMFAGRFDIGQWGSGFAEGVLPGGEELPVPGVWLMRSWSSSDFEAAVHRRRV